MTNLNVGAKVVLADDYIGSYTYGAVGEIEGFRTQWDGSCENKVASVKWSNGYRNTVCLEYLTLHTA